MDAVVDESWGCLAGGMKDAPVDAVIIGIVDSVDVLGKQIYSGMNWRMKCDRTDGLRRVLANCPPPLMHITSSSAATAILERWKAGLELLQ